jgi:CBS domain containing-hemolysin-like protein
VTELAMVALVTAVLVLVNGVYVAAEFAVMGARPTRVHQLAEAGNAVARRIRRLLRDPGRQDAYFATAQLGITVASLLLGMYGEHSLVHLLEPVLGRLALPEGAVAAVAAALAVGAMTFLHVVVGEMVPKSVALRYPETVMMRLDTGMRVSALLFLPFVRLLNGVGNLLLRLMRIPPPAAHERIMSPEELELVIEESTEGGRVTPRAGQILINILDFSDRTAHEVMTPRTRIDALPLGIDEDTLTRRLAASRHTRFPVYDGDIDHVVGVLHLKDFVRWQLAGETPYDLGRLLRPVRRVPELMPLEELLETFRREQRHLAIVLDEYGGTAGLVSLEDLVEEVVGEVTDEFDDEPTPIQPQPDGSWLVTGEVLVEDLAEWVELPDERPDVATVGGLVQTLLGRPAEAGDTVSLGRARLTVERVDGLAVARVRVSPQAGTSGLSPAPAPGR